MGQLAESSPLTFIDLFAGIGGMRLAFESQGFRCVFSSEIDEPCRKMYEANFGERPYGDIRQIDAADIPDHDVLLAGFPCQPFSIMGKGLGLVDTRGTLFFEIERILKAKRPRAFLLENVKQLRGNDKGRTLKVILSTLKGLGYHVDWKILNCLDFGLPQKRERLFIVGFQNDCAFQFPSRGEGPSKTLADILEENVSKKYFLSDAIRKKRLQAHTSPFHPGIWHENKSGHISSYPYSCALRASASHNYLVVDGVRRLTPRECLRLMGFPDTFKIVVSDAQVRKQAGNSVCVPLVAAIARRMKEILIRKETVAEMGPIFALGSQMEGDACHAHSRG